MKPVFIKIALRNMLRHKVYTLINIAGLAVGIAGFLIIVMYIQHETGFDKYHPDLERSYRMVGIQKPAGIDQQHVAITTGMLGPTMKADFPEVEAAVRLMRAFSVMVMVDDKSFPEYNAYYADPTIFKVLGLELLAGDSETALQDVNMAAISETMAEKYFGSHAEAMNKTIEVSGVTYRINGIIGNRDVRSHIKIDLALSLATIANTYPGLHHWASNSLATYVLLREGVDKQAVEDKLPALVEQYITSEGWWQGLELYMQPVPDIYLHSGNIRFHLYHRVGDIQSIYVYTAIAALILLVACINFINLTTARSMKRAREVGIKKVSGATHLQLFFQFISETLIITTFAILIALAITDLATGTFSRLLNVDLAIDFTGNPVFNIGLVLILVVITLIAGFYPAMFMSRLQPVMVLRSASAGGGRGRFRKLLVFLQFFISTALIFSILVIQKQVGFMLNKDLGYDVENVLAVPLFSQQSREKYELVKNELANLPFVEGVAAASQYNGVAGRQSSLFSADDSELEIMARYGYVDAGFFPLMGMKLKAGRFFHQETGTDHHSAIIINESAAQSFGWDEPIGKRVRVSTQETEPVRTVVGVIADYHYYSLRNKIEPAAWYMQPEDFGVIVARIKKHEIKLASHMVEQTWNEVLPAQPYNAFFIDQRIEQIYREEMNTRRVISYFALLCIFISSMGLFGLTSFMIAQKTREIGIRKIMGGSVGQITLMLVRDFLVMIGIAGIAATPVAYYYLERWLANYAYRISFYLHYMIPAIVIAIAIALATIIYQTIRAANSNPVDAIRYE
jgi:putative ABC transport system permease protein